MTVSSYIIVYISPGEMLLPQNIKKKITYPQKVKFYLIITSEPSNMN